MYFKIKDTGTKIQNYVKYRNKGNKNPNFTACSRHLFSQKSPICISMHFYLFTNITIFYFLMKIKVN